LAQVVYIPFELERLEGLKIELLEVPFHSPKQLLLIAKRKCNGISDPWTCSEDLPPQRIVKIHISFNFRPRPDYRGSRPSALIG